MTIPRFPANLVHQGAVALDSLLKWSIKIFLPQFVGADMVLIERGEIYENFVEDMHNRGLRVCAWTVNDSNEMIWMAQKLKIPFLTDRPLNAHHLLDATDGVNNAEVALT
uniref:GP-PDE domain-containing protein n=1 Tax=Globodera rostochiensis TaxID=31243 RepID=A0A914HWR5_GLORO